MKFEYSLEEEKICDHLVTSEMKNIWSKQLELLQKFDEVCSKHNLPYFASGGTLLGAVRHKGYIPWDDDLDVHMLWSDYEKLSKIANDELKPFFWQDHLTQPGFSPWHAKIRNSETTGFTEFERDNWTEDFNRGIFIDIFPIFFIPKNSFVHFLQRMILTVLRRVIVIYEKERRNEIFAQRKGQKHRPMLLCKLLKCIMPYDKACANFIKVCSWQKEPTEYVGATSFDCNEKRFIWKASYYRETVDLPFMGGTIKCPIEYDAWLKRQFGDYMVIKKGASMHSNITFDVNTPYRDKIKMVLEELK